MSCAVEMETETEVSAFWVAFAHPSPQLGSCFRPMQHDHNWAVEEEEMKVESSCMDSLRVEFTATVSDGIALPINRH
jgi:hypothetical protein